MPFVNVQTIKGIMSSEQKNELLRRMTDLIVEIEGKVIRSFGVRYGSGLMSMSLSSGVWEECNPHLK
jgi:hypothetical protein